ESPERRRLRLRLVRRDGPAAGTAVTGGDSQEASHRRRHDRQRTGLELWRLAGEPRFPRVARGCELRLLTILLTQDWRSRRFLHSPVRVKVKRRDEPPEGGRVNRAPPPIVLCVARVLETAPNAAGAEAQEALR